MTWICNRKIHYFFKKKESHSGCIAKALLYWAEATKVWEEARHAQMALIGNMNRVYSKITTVWPGWRPSHLSLATKPDGLAVQCCLELLFSERYVNWDMKQLNKEWEVGDGQGNTQHVTASQAWRDDVIFVLSLSEAVKFYIGHLLFMEANHYKFSLKFPALAERSPGCFLLLFHSSMRTTFMLYNLFSTTAAVRIKLNRNMLHRHKRRLQQDSVRTSCWS